MVDPGPLFAAAAGGSIIVEDVWAPASGEYGLIWRSAHWTVSTIWNASNLRRRARTWRNADRSHVRRRHAAAASLRDGGGRPDLRRAAPHVHPRIEASALAPLLEQAGLVRPVVDVDRVAVRYPSLMRLVADLRAMGATSLLRAARNAFPWQGGSPPRKRNSNARPRTGAPPKSSKSFILPHGSQAVNRSEGQVVERLRLGWPSWTRTRGGWRGRYPDEYTCARVGRGATAIEYGLIVALIVVAMMVGLQGLGGGVGGMWKRCSAPTFISAA